MNDDIDNLKKKILYRSTYRGTKEMDKLLGSFTKHYINAHHPMYSLPNHNCQLRKNSFCP